MVDKGLGSYQEGIERSVHRKFDKWEISFEIKTGELQSPQSDIVSMDVSNAPDPLSLEGQNYEDLWPYDQSPHLSKGSLLRLSP